MESFSDLVCIHLQMSRVPAVLPTAEECRHELTFLKQTKFVESAQSTKFIIDRQVQYLVISENYLERLKV